MILRLLPKDRDMSCAEQSIEFFVRTDPDPYPQIASSTGYGTVVEGNTHRPGARIPTQSLEIQTRVGRIRPESFICRAGSRFDRRRKGSVLLPKFRCAGRLHSYLLNSASFSSRNCEGSSRSRASISSRNLVNFGEGVGSLMIRSHSASPSSSGTSAGSDSASCARSSFDRFLIAFWISSTVLTPKFYDNAVPFTRRRLAT